MRVRVASICFLLACNRAPVADDGTSSSDSGTASTQGSDSTATSAEESTSSTSTSESSTDGSGSESDEGEASTGPVFDMMLPVPDLPAGECYLPPSSELSFEGSLALSGCTPVEFDGRVMSTDSNTMVVDGCPCELDCTQEDPQTITLVSPDGLPTMFPIVPGACVEISVLPSNCSGAHLAVFETEAEFPDCSLAVFYSDQRKTYVAPPFEHELLGVNWSYLEGDESCTQDDTFVEYGSIEGVLPGDLDFEVEHLDWVNAGACYTGGAVSVSYIVRALSALHHANSDPVPPTAQVELHVRREVLTIPPP